MEPRHRTYIWYERRLRLFVLQGVPVNLLIVKFNEGPVERKPVRFVGDTDGVGVEDEADDSLVWVRPPFGDLVVKTVQVIN